MVELHLQEYILEKFLIKLCADKLDSSQGFQLNIKIYNRNKSDIDKESGSIMFKGLYDITRINNIILQIIRNYLLCQSC